MNLSKAQKFLDSSDAYIRDIFTCITKHAKPKDICGDSDNVILQMSSADIDEFMYIEDQYVRSRYIERGISFESPSEAHDKILLRIAGDMLGGDNTGLINKKNRVGTLIDPAVYTHSEIPVMLGPYEGSSIYAPGGLPATIIDKKSRGMTIKGATFKAYDEFWDTKKIQLLEDAAYTTGFNDIIGDTVAEAFIYGGSLCYPVFKKDTPSTMVKDIDKLFLEKGCIERWVNTDRWNITIVPSYVVTSKDYLHPKTIYIPQSALEINTSRIALVKPKPVPYWIALCNIGWSPSDFSGWLRAYYGYEITCQSIPVMAQQMSLLLYKMPLDALNATIGSTKVRELMEINEEKMAEWSALSPKAVNMVGDVEVVNRTYSGFEQFVGAMKSDLAAQCGLPEPTLWHTPNKGFSDNTTESLLKQSETLQMSQSFIERSMKPCTDVLIAHVFGTDSKEWENRNSVRISFNKPVISTEKDLAEVGARFAASVSSFVQAGVAPDTALKLSQQFFPTVKITEEILNEAKKSYEEQMKRESQNAMNNKPLGRKQGHTVGVSTNVGAFAK